MKLPVINKPRFDLSFLKNGSIFKLEKTSSCDSCICYISSSTEYEIAFTKLHNNEIIYITIDDIEDYDITPMVAIEKNRIQEIRHNKIDRSYFEPLLNTR